MSTKIVDFSARLDTSGVDEQFIQRWSPRAFQPFEIADEVMQRIMSAARRSRTRPV